MPEIRKLRSLRAPTPSVRIALPAKPAPARKIYRSKRVHVVRRRVDFPSPTPQDTPCVLWQGVLDKHGYGRMKVRRGNRIVAMGPHRWVMDVLMFEEHGRHLRKSEVVLHACDQPLCFRVDHLSIGTVQQNNLDMLQKGRASKPPRNVFYGTNHPMARLNDQQVYEMRQAYRDGSTMQELADAYDVGRTTVRKVVRGITWIGPAPKPLDSEPNAPVKGPSEDDVRITW